MLSNWLLQWLIQQKIFIKGLKFVQKLQLLMEDKHTENPIDEQQTTQESVNEQIGKQDETVEKLKQENAELKDKFMRLYADMENLRRRTAKEKLELQKTANESLMLAMLPVLDDFERATKNFSAETKELEAVKIGFDLIHNKMFKALEQKGLVPIVSVGEVFNSELHEAITQTPAPTEDMKGKVVDEVEKGYYLGEKVIRFSKVIIGA
jgi:molecular chaperone GrpE